MSTLGLVSSDDDAFKWTHLAFLTQAPLGQLGETFKQMNRDYYNLQV